MRPLITLYKIAYGRLLFANDGDFRGLCHMFITLAKEKLITTEELKTLHKDLMKNKPSEFQHLEFFCEETWMGSDSPFWWEPGELELRRKFLSKMINYSKPWHIKFYLWWTNRL